MSKLIGIVALVIGLFISMTSFSQNSKQDTIYLPAIVINDSFPELYSKIDISDSIDSWQELVLFLPIENKTKYPLIITRISTGDGGMLPVTRTSSLHPTEPGDKVLLTYKYVRAGNILNKTINFNFMFMDINKEMQYLRINRQVVKKLNRN